MRRKLQICIIFVILITVNLLIYYSGILKSEIVIVTGNTDIKSGNQETFKDNKEQNHTFLQYSKLLDCYNFYNTTTLKNEKPQDYTHEANAKLHSMRFVRGVLLYFPAEQSSHFEQEFKWVHRSWIEMQIYEPNTWRTDLIIFTNTDKLTNRKFFDDLNCSIKNSRQSKNDMPMCILINYVPIKDRIIIQLVENNQPSVEVLYDHLYKKVNVFDDNPNNLWRFYKNLQTLNNYNYLDSILMAFDGYKHLNESYDFLLRSDMDVFLTPFFGKWLPLNCNDFIVGGGGYSNDFNMKRLGRVAKHLGLGFSGSRNLGSTWYSTPTQFRLVAYLTLVSMTYISNEEFSEPERQGKVGTILWPEWHYGVLLLYGQNLAMNHLIATKQINVVALPDLIDYPSGNENSVYQIVHIHVFHGDNIFSKFMFRAGKYDNMSTTDIDKKKVKYYALAMALESKRLKETDQLKLLNAAIKDKS